jgi:hypothetical protein
MTGDAGAGRFGHAVGSSQDARHRHVAVGISHPSDDPARHRNFGVVADYREGVGWVAHLTEDDHNDQPRMEPVGLHAPDRSTAFPTAAECLGDAVAMLVRMVDGDAELDTATRTAETLQGGRA